jgi:hypothetical protein
VTGPVNDQTPHITFAHLPLDDFINHRSQNTSVHPRYKPDEMKLYASLICIMVLAASVRASLKAP